MSYIKSSAIDLIDAIAERITKLSDDIWDHPETCYTEVESAALQKAVLAELGFQIEENLAGIPTAFSGRIGSGKPVIGVLGEFDALSGLSQVAGVAAEEPLIAGANGHGCGHNLLGSASIAATYAAGQYLRENGLPGTVIYYGCPAEEGGSGKGFMARDGVFDELDCAITWHPGDLNVVVPTSSLANVVVRYCFHGIAAHAAGAPELGRSALDAVTLMNTGVQFLREHVIQEARIHYAVTDTGGVSPNVVQAKAEVLYMIRAPRIDQVMEIADRVDDVAKGAALMTGTTMERIFVKATSNLVPNRALNEVLQENMEATPLPVFDEADQTFAKAIIKSYAMRSSSLGSHLNRVKGEEAAALRGHLDDPIYNFVLPLSEDESAMPGSTDVGDCSWVTPTAQIGAVTMAADTPGHSWQLVSQGKSPIAHKGELFAAKVMAGAVIDLFDHPEIVGKAQEEHADRLEHKKFISPIPKDVRPAALIGR